MKAFYASIKETKLPVDFVTLENEVNFYFNPFEDDYAALHASFLECMMALIYMPNNVGKVSKLDPSLLGHIQQLQDHLSSKGITIPVLQVNVEEPLSLLHWSPGVTIDINNDFYDLKEISRLTKRGRV
jgi:hypothetical protein